MDREELFVNGSAGRWSSCNYGSEQVKNGFFNPSSSWENSMDPFESSALSSLVSSPVASNATAVPAGGGDGFIIREFIGRLGSICNSGGGGGGGGEQTHHHNNSIKVAGSQMNARDGNSDKKISRLSPENGEESSVSEPQSQNDANSRKRKPFTRGKAKETTTPSSTNDSKVVTENEESNAKRSKQEESNDDKDNSKAPEAPKDYIHVRARRGQATDSHSLAERVRREKISERMKFLQDLVPGCKKVTGKAVMLDEIINYVQSLQRQVEFLSMKLSTVNPRVEARLPKDMFQSGGALQNSLYQVDPTFQPQQGLPDTQFSINPLNAAALHRNLTDNGYGEPSPQVPSFWEDDLQSLVQMGSNQNRQEGFHGSMATAQMKIEL